MPRPASRPKASTWPGRHERGPDPPATTPPSNRRPNRSMTDTPTCPRPSGPRPEACPGWAVRRAGLWLRDAAIKIGPALSGSLTPPRAWGIMVRNPAFRRIRVCRRSCLPLRGAAQGLQPGASPGRRRPPRPDRGPSLPPGSAASRARRRSRGGGLRPPLTPPPRDGPTDPGRDDGIGPWPNNRMKPMMPTTLTLKPSYESGQGGLGVASCQRLWG